MQFEEVFPFAKQGKLIYSISDKFNCLAIKEGELVDSDGEKVLLDGQTLLRSDWEVLEHVELEHLINICKEYDRRGEALHYTHWYTPNSALKAYGWICQRIKELDRV